MLAPDALMRELVSLGFISGTSLLQDPWRLEFCSRRHSNFWLELKPGHGIFVKCSRGGELESGRTLANEAHFCREVAENPILAAMRPFVPRFMAWEASRSWLVLEPLRGTQNWWEAAVPAAGVAPDVFAALGQALGHCHHAAAGWRTALSNEKPNPAPNPALTPPPDPAPAWQDTLSSTLPWIRRLAEPPVSMLAHLRPGEWKLLEALQQEPLQQDPRWMLELLALEQIWRPLTLIHNDFKADNLLVFPAAQTNENPRVVLVDWEMVQWGDPAWDFAAVLREILELWVERMPQEVALDPTSRVAAAPVALEQLQVGVRAFADAYRAVFAPSQGELAPGWGNWEEFLTRAVAYSAASLVCACWMRQSALTEKVLSVTNVLLLQIAVNITRRPDVALHQLWGLSA